MLNSWDNFFLMAGTAAATLFEVLFVAVTLGPNLSTARGEHGTRVFLTPRFFNSAPRYFSAWPWWCRGRPRGRSGSSWPCAG